MLKIPFKVGICTRNTQKIDFVLSMFYMYHNIWNQQTTFSFYPPIWRTKFALQIGGVKMNLGK